MSDPAMADKMLGVLAANGARRAMVVYGDDGLDELSTTGPSTVHELIARRPTAGYETLDVPDRPCASSGWPRPPSRTSAAGTPTFNAEAIRQVIAGEPSPHRDIAVLNAAAALVVIGQAGDLAGRGGAGLRGDRRRPGRRGARGADPGLGRQAVGRGRPTPRDRARSRGPAAARRLRSGASAGRLKGG